jgi:hypothetical protein
MDHEKSRFKILSEHIDGYIGICAAANNLTLHIKLYC